VRYLAPGWSQICAASGETMPGGPNYRQLHQQIRTGDAELLLPSSAAAIPAHSATLFQRNSSAQRSPIPHRRDAWTR
jgi:hypothetical protein